MKTKYFIMAILFVVPFISAQTDLLKNNCATKECHESLMTKSLIHSPLNDGCETCHEKKDGKHPDANGPEFSLMDSGAALCETCHESEVNKKVVHAPFYNGECTKCHSPHSSNLVSLIKGENQKEICEECHQANDQDNKFGHGPYVSNQCLSCHVGHQSEFKSLVNSKDPELCFQCHQGKEFDLELANVHPVFKEGCLDCHSPHTSPASNMLVTSGNELCYTCHKSVESDVNTSKVVHQPLSKNGTCVSCHSPHAGELTNLLVNEQPNLCFNCHSENITNKEKYIDVYGRLTKEFVHKPLLENLCTDCHLPHVSKNSNLLAEAFPDGNYTKPKIDNFSMCFQCHDSKKITNKVTNLDTGFRDGSKNLHSVHVMKKKSISCQSCHDMHGADNAHIIGNVVYFGKWEMPINYVVNENGGTCLPGCHVQYSYDRTKN